MKDKDFYRRIGSIGGRKTVENHGREHMREIGKRGHAATTKRYFRNEAAHRRWLAEMGSYVYWQQTGLPQRYTRDGVPIYPEQKPPHPAHPDYTEF